MFARISFNPSDRGLHLKLDAWTGELQTAWFPVPLEIHAMARILVTRACEALGATATLRYGRGKAGPVVTDNGHLILDLTFKRPVDCASMESELKLITGVFEVGLFSGRASAAYLGQPDGTCRVLRKP